MTSGLLLLLLMGEVMWQFAGFEGPICLALTKADSLGPPVVGRGEGAEALLAGRVPDGQFAPLAARLYLLHSEVHT